MKTHKNCSPGALFGTCLQLHKPDSLHPTTQLVRDPFCSFFNQVAVQDLGLSSFLDTPNTFNSQGSSLPGGDVSIRKMSLYSICIVY